MDENFEHCSIEAADEPLVIHNALRDDFGPVDASVLMTFGIGNSARLRRGGKRSVSRYYKIKLKEVVAPARRKTGAQSSGSHVVNLSSA